jgi:hypothetical protein
MSSQTLISLHAKVKIARRDKAVPRRPGQIVNPQDQCPLPPQQLREVQDASVQNVTGQDTFVQDTPSPMGDVVLTGDGKRKAPFSLQKVQAEIRSSETWGFNAIDVVMGEVAWIVGETRPLTLENLVQKRRRICPCYKAFSVAKFCHGKTAIPSPRARAGKQA